MGRVYYWWMDWKHVFWVQNGQCEWKIIMSNTFQTSKELFTTYWSTFWPPPNPKPKGNSSRLQRIGTQVPLVDPEEKQNMFPQHWERSLWVLGWEWVFLALHREIGAAIPIRSGRLVFSVLKDGVTKPATKLFLLHNSNLLWGSGGPDVVSGARGLGRVVGGVGWGIRRCYCSWVGDNDGCGWDWLSWHCRIRSTVEFVDEFVLDVGVCEKCNGDWDFFFRTAIRK